MGFHLIAQLLMTQWLMTTALFAQGVLLNDADRARVNATAEKYPWASAAKANILKAADSFPQAHLDRFELIELALPPEGGQWWHWYVCPAQGTRLRFEPPDRHVCPVDNKRWSGWPYDQVIYASRHDDLAAAARDLALAYRLTGKREYANQGGLDSERVRRPLPGAAAARPQHQQRPQWRARPCAPPPMTTR